MWDTATGGEVRSVYVTEQIGGCELSKGKILTVATGSTVVFLNAHKLEKLKEVAVPCPVYTASLNNEKDIFLCGGEDLKLYKYDWPRNTLELRKSC